MILAFSGHNIDGKYDQNWWNNTKAKPYNKIEYCEEGSDGRF